MSSRFIIAVGIVAVTSSFACREQDPLPEYNYALVDSQGGQPLLPVTRVVAGSRDASILQSGQATIIRRDEIDSPEAQAMMKEQVPNPIEEMPEATTPGEALSNVGKAFFGSLMRAGPKSSGSAPVGEAPAGDTPTEDDEAADGGGAADDDGAARKTFAEYNQDLGAGRYTSLAKFCAADQKSKAESYFGSLDEMNTSVSSLLDAYEKSSSGVKARFEQVLSEKRSALTVDSVNVSGASATVAATASDGKSISMSMVEESGSWRLIHPVIDAASDWTAFESDLETHIESLDDAVDELSGGASADNAKLDKLIEDAIAYLSALPK
ncbi:MAG: hypothetical protein GXP29_05635 [Planctomycetes bacterium]|nr:hypothetical protein [Planctomycetota bacterium]